VFRAIRVLTGLLGFGLGIYGARLLLERGHENLFAAGRWLIGGVVLHDGLIGPATILAAAVVGLVLRGRRLPAPVVVGAIVLASVTLVAVPVLGRYGARPDNPTLLDRSYGVGWFVFAGLTLLVVAVASWRSRMHSSAEGGDDGTDPGGR
jgi:hypothetical protein